jgi:hypothetical protein
MYSKEVERQARQLRRTLLQRVIGKVKGDFFCSSCQMMHAAAKAGNIHYDRRGQHPNWVSDWTRWVVEMQHLGCHEPMYYRDLSILIPQEELYAIFRETFAPLGLSVRRPAADAYRESTEEDYRRKFRPSGKTVNLQGANSCFYVRPSGDLRKSMWTSAEIRIESQNPAGAEILCRLDPDESSVLSQVARAYEPVHATGQGRLTFYVGKPMYEQECPALALLVGKDASSGVYTFELDENVELVEPELFKPTFPVGSGKSSVLLGQKALIKAKLFMILKAWTLKLLVQKLVAESSPLKPATQTLLKQLEEDPSMPISICKLPCPSKPRKALCNFNADKQRPKRGEEQP